MVFSIALGFIPMSARPPILRRIDVIEVAGRRTVEGNLRKFMTTCLMVACVLLTGVAAAAPTTRPTTRPAADVKDPLRSMSADQVLHQILKPATNPSTVLPPMAERPVLVKTSGRSEEHTSE